MLLPGSRTQLTLKTIWERRREHRRCSIAGENRQGQRRLEWTTQVGPLLGRLPWKGCGIARLGINENIPEAAEAFDVVFWPCAADGKVRDIEKLPAAASTFASSTVESATASMNTWLDSRTALILPDRPDLRIEVNVGDRVLAGVSVPVRRGD